MKKNEYEIIVSALQERIEVLKQTRIQYFALGFAIATLIAVFIK